MNYKLLNSAGTWRKGDVVTEKEINDTNLGGVNRLLALKAVEETSDPAKLHSDEPSSPNETKGDNVEVGSDDTVDKRAGRRAESVGVVNDGKRTADESFVANPRTGSPGTVIRTTGNQPKK